ECRLHPSKHAGGDQSYSYPGNTAVRSGAGHVDSLAQRHSRHQRQSRSFRAQVEALQSHGPRNCRDHVCYRRCSRWNGSANEPGHSGMGRRNDYGSAVAGMPFRIPPDESRYDLMKQIVIIGGGLAGLSAGYHLREYDPIVFEKEQAVGGLCRSFSQDGFTFDCTGHLIHLKNQYTKDLISRILPDAFGFHERLAAIYSKSTITPYPFQANTYGLPAEVIKECVVGIHCLPQALAQQLRKVYVSETLEYINAKKKYVRLKSGREESYDFLISTLPVSVVYQMIQDAPDALRHEASRLKAISVLNINI